MSIRGFTRFMTCCPCGEFSRWLIPVAVVMVPFMAVACLLVPAGSALYLIACFVASFMDFAIDAAKLLTGVSLTDVGPFLFSTANEPDVPNSFSERLNRLLSQLFSCR